MALERRESLMSKMKVDLGGLNRAITKLADLGEDGEKLALATVTVATVTTQAEAKKGIAAGGKSGRTYQRRSVTHRASAPGQYPATDTGRLLSSVDMILPSPTNMEGTVGTDVKYGPMLEFGTSKMAARPWLMPSFVKGKEAAEAQLKAKGKRLGYDV